MKKRAKQNKYDQIRNGFVAGLVVPLFVFVGVYLANNSEMHFVDYLQSLWKFHILVKLGSLCVFANLAVFMGFIYKKYDKAAKGVLAATLVYAFAVLVSSAF